MAFAALTIDLNAQMARFEEALNRGNRQMDTFATKASAAAKAVNTGFAAIGVTLGVAGIAAFAKSGIDAADALNDLSDRTGVSVRNLASFQLAATLADTSLENLGAGIGKLTRSIGEAERGNRTIQQALAELGVTARDPREAFLQLADGVERITDPARRAALLNQVLGRSYEELLPLLNQGGAALREAANNATDYADAMTGLAPAAAKFNDRIDALKNSIGALAAQTLTAPVDSFNEYISALSDILEKGSLIDKLGFFTLGYIPEDTLNRISDAGDRVQAYNREIFKLQQQLVELRRVETADSPNIRTWESRIAELEGKRAELVKKVKDAASSAASKQAANDTIQYGKQLQDALSKAFSTRPLDEFVKSFAEKRKKIADEYAALRAELSGSALGDNATSLDVSTQITRAKAALQSGDLEAAQQATAKAKSLFTNVAAKEGTVGFEKDYFLRQLEALENETINASESTAIKVREAIESQLAQLNADATKINVDIDPANLVSQIKLAIDQARKDLEANPIKVPIVGVPTITPDGRQSVDLSRAAQQYGRR